MDKIEDLRIFTSELPDELKLDILEFAPTLDIDISREKILNRIHSIDPTYTHVITPIDITQYSHLYGYNLFNILHENEGIIISFNDKEKIMNINIYQPEDHGDSLDYSSLFEDMEILYSEIKIDEDNPDTLQIPEDRYDELKKDIYLLYYSLHPRFDILSYNPERYNIYSNRYNAFDNQFLDPEYKDMLIKIHRKSLVPLEDVEDLYPHVSIAILRARKIEQLMGSLSYQIYQIIKDTNWNFDLYDGNVYMTIESNEILDLPFESDYQKSDGKFVYEFGIDNDKHWLVDLPLLAILDDNCNYNITAESLIIH